VSSVSSEASGKFAVATVSQFTCVNFIQVTPLTLDCALGFVMKANGEAQNLTCILGKR